MFETIMMTFKLIRDKPTLVITRARMLHFDTRKYTTKASFEGD